MSKAMRSVLTGSLLAALESVKESEAIEIGEDGTAKPIAIKAYPGLAMEPYLYKGPLEPNYTRFNSFKKRKKGRS